LPKLHFPRMEKPCHGIFEEIWVIPPVEPPVKLIEVSVHMLLAHVMEGANNRARPKTLGPSSSAGHCTKSATGNAPLPNVMWVSKRQGFRPRKGCSFSIRIA